MRRQINFRTLKPNEIEVRPQSFKNGKARMLLYIDSRAATALLDETVGNMNWQSEFYTVNNQIMCRIGIFDEDRNMWIWKSDTGSESNIEKEKGLISDCYKRVLTRFGITELYTSPVIEVDDDGYKCSGYKVSEIEYNSSREIIKLVIVNRFGNEVFRWSVTNGFNKTTTVPCNKTATSIEDMIGNLEWSEEAPKLNFVGTVQKPVVTEKPKTTAIDILNQWYSTKQNPTNDEQRFYSTYSTKIINGDWKGSFQLNKLLEKWNLAS